jgi:hypothetical protein
VFVTIGSYSSGAGIATSEVSYTTFITAVPQYTHTIF